LVGPWGRGGFWEDLVLTVFKQEIREEPENKLTQRRKGAKVKTRFRMAAKRCKNAKKKNYRSYRASWREGNHLLDIGLLTRQSGLFNAKP
jgi:hypothetical protein